LIDILPDEEEIERRTRWDLTVKKVGENDRIPVESRTFVFDIEDIVVGRLLWMEYLRYSLKLARPNLVLIESFLIAANSLVSY